MVTRWQEWSWQGLWSWSMRAPAHSSTQVSPNCSTCIQSLPEHVLSSTAHNSLRLETTPMSIYIEWVKWAYTQTVEYSPIMIMSVLLDAVTWRVCKRNTDKGIQSKSCVLCKSFCAISRKVPSQAIFIRGVRRVRMGLPYRGGVGPLGEVMGRWHKRE